jgi:putative chitinase
MGNGDEASGDGYKFRGRGVFQLTGKDNYQAFSKYYKDNIGGSVDFLSEPDQVASNAEYSILSALWFFNKNIGGLKMDATKESVTAVTKKVNGGVNGLSDRQAIFTRAVGVLLVAPILTTLGGVY